MSLDPEALQSTAAQARADLEDESNRTRAAYFSSCPDPDRGRQSSTMGDTDIAEMKKRFPFLNDFSETFIKSHPLEALLKLETTSIKIQEYERGKAASSKLAANRDSIATTFFTVREGKDNRWDTLHEARFLPGAGCTAAKIWLRAREVMGEKGIAPISTYDMNSVGLAGFVSKKGWCELHQPGSDSISLKMFNINACSSKVAVTGAGCGGGEEFKDIVDLGEFKLALRVARSAQSFVFPWNKSIEAIEGFMHRSNFCASDLSGIDKPAITLTQFVDFAMESNADRWKNQEPFLATGDLKTAWDSFYGARPESKLQGQPKKPKQDQKGKPQFNNYMPAVTGAFDDICSMYNLGKCVKPPGTCTTRTGIPLRHVCNFMADMRKPAEKCEKPHPRTFNH